MRTPQLRKGVGFMTVLRASNLTERERERGSQFRVCTDVVSRSIGKYVPNFSVSGKQRNFENSGSQIEVTKVQR